MQPDGKIICGGGQVSRYPGATLGMLVTAVIAVEVPKYIVIFYVPKGIAFQCTVLCWQVLIAGLPFFLARAVPALARFDRQWLPSVWSHWVWFLWMVFLLLIVGRLHAWLLTLHKDWLLIHTGWQEAATDCAPVSVVLSAVVAILIAPIAEGLFWRVFLLPQFNKLTVPSIALFVQSSLYSLSHIPAYWSVLAACFFYGTILGVWRLKFRCLLPLILAHMILNGVALGPHLWRQYAFSVRSYSKCREIDHLTTKPVTTAVPALIALISDREDAISLHALEVLGKNYRSEAEPYIAEALASSGVYTVDRALSAIGWLGYSRLRPQVRALVWSSDDVGIQISSVLTLRWIGTEEELSDIVQTHPEERVRRAARDMLQGLHREGEEKGQGVP